MWHVNQSALKTLIAVVNSDVCAYKLLGHPVHHPSFRSLRLHPQDPHPAHSYPEDERQGQPSASGKTMEQMLRNTFSSP